MNLKKIDPSEVKITITLEGMVSYCGMLHRHPTLDYFDFNVDGCPRAIIAFDTLDEDTRKQVKMLNIWEIINMKKLNKSNCEIHKCFYSETKNKIINIVNKIKFCKNDHGYNHDIICLVPEIIEILE